MVKYDFDFCHDFQNKTCSRGACKFIHCTREEEDYYKTTGQLPAHILEAAIRQGLAHDLPLKKVINLYT